MTRKTLLVTGIVILALTIPAVVFACYVGKTKQSTVAHRATTGSSPITLSQGQQQGVPLTSQSSNDCSLDPNEFLSQVNALRASLNEVPLTYDKRLEQSAAAHISDMEQFNYFGHTNPINKHDSSYFIDRFSPNSGSGEIEDGPLIAKSAFDDFKNSPPHYQIMTAANAKFIGVYSVYYGKVLPNYDDAGNPLNTDEGTPGCIVVADITR